MTFYGAPQLPFTVRRMPYAARKTTAVWPEGRRMAVLVYSAPEEWMWDRQEPFPPSPIRTSAGELVPSLSSRSAVGYGFEVGLPRLCDLLRERNLSLTMWTNGNAVGQHPDIMRHVVEQGHEIEAHGFTEGRPQSTMTYAQQRDDVLSTTAILEELTGVRPRGWLGPGAMATSETLEIVAGEGYEFHCDFQDDELPYFLDVAGRTLVEIPYRMVGNLNDLWLLTSHYRSLSDASRHLKESFDACYAAAAETPMLFIYGTHPYVTGRPDFASVLTSFLDHVASKDDVWLTTYRDVAAWWSQRFASGYE